VPISGTRDEILVGRVGRFAGFSGIDERDLPAALAKLIRHRGNPTRRRPTERELAAESPQAQSGSRFRPRRLSGLA
jgi:hypothetical protein